MRSAGVGLRSGTARFFARGKPAERPDSSSGSLVRGTEPEREKVAGGGGGGVREGKSIFLHFYE